jgi:hypothetical protein
MYCRTMKLVTITDMISRKYLILHVPHFRDFRVYMHDFSLEVLLVKKLRILPLSVVC